MRWRLLCSVIRTEVSWYPTQFRQWVTGYMVRKPGIVANKLRRKKKPRGREGPRGWSQKTVGSAPLDTAVSGCQDRETIMSCGRGTLVDDSLGYVDLKVPFCNTWDCDDCRPRRRLRCEWEVRRGNPTRFLTLTVDPALFKSPWAARPALGRAVPLLMRRLERATHQRIAYWAGCERHKNGWPHIHIALRCKYLPQKMIKRIWIELGMGAIVDIRKIYSRGGVAHYMNKYFAKGLARYISKGAEGKRHISKRYWKSRDWELPEEKAKQKPFVPRFRLYTRVERFDVLHWAARLRFWGIPLKLSDGVVRLNRNSREWPPPGWLWSSLRESQPRSWHPAPTATE